MAGILNYAWDPTNKKWVPLRVDADGSIHVVGYVDELNDIGDVNVPTPADDEVLYWDDAAGKWQTKAISAAAWADIIGKPTAPSLEELATEHDAAGLHAGMVINNIGDVNAPTPSDNDALTWDDATSKWIPGAVAVEAAAVALEKYGGIFWFWLADTIDGFDDSYNNSGSLTLNAAGGRADIKSSATLNNYADYRKVALRAGNPATWDKKRRLKVWAAFRADTAQETYIVSGDPSGTYRKFGFKLVDNLLKGCVADGSTEALTGTLETISASYAFKLLEAVLDPDIPECRFFIDGVDKGALTTNLPTGTSESMFFFGIRVKTTESVEKEVRLGEVRCVQAE